jgi:flagellar motility protein MotE (MotC chaperone)
MSLYQSSRDKHPELLNIGKPWTTEQENLLIKKVGEGKNHEELSIEFGRTTGGIRSRLREIACEMIGLGKTIEYAIEKTKLSKEVIQESLDKRGVARERKVAKKEKKVSNINEIFKVVESKEKYEMKEVIDYYNKIDM